MHGLHPWRTGGKLLLWFMGTVAAFYLGQFLERKKVAVQAAAATVIELKPAPLDLAPLTRADRQYSVIFKIGESNARFAD